MSGLGEIFSLTIREIVTEKIQLNICDGACFATLVKG